MWGIPRGLSGCAASLRGGVRLNPISQVRLTKLAVPRSIALRFLRIRIRHSGRRIVGVEPWVVVIRRPGPERGPSTPTPSTPAPSEANTPSAPTPSPTAATPSPAPTPVPAGMAPAPSVAPVSAPGSAVPNGG